MELTGKYRIGIIGAGSIVESCHLPVLKNLDNVTIDWVFDKNAARSNLLSKMFKVPVISDWENGIQKIDICLVTIPYGVRSPYLEKLAEAGKAVYVEKPFALTVSEHDSWASKFADHMFAVGFQRRFYKIVQDLNSIVKSKVFGKLSKIVLRQGNFSLKGGGGYLSDVNLAGGGVIVESGIHCLDQLLMVTSAEDIIVDSVESVCVGGIDYDTIFKSQIRASDGSIHVDAHMTTLQNLDNGIEFEFDQAIVRTNLTPDAVVSVQTPDGNSFLLARCDSGIDTEDFSSSVIGSFGCFWTSYISSLDSKKANKTSYRTSILTTKWIQEIYGKIR
jgi:predicted dehydrogenase